MAHLVRHGADVNSVEASAHLHQSSPYRWVRSLSRWDSHLEFNSPGEEIRYHNLRNLRRLIQAMFAPPAQAMLATPLQAMFAPPPAALTGPANTLPATVGQWRQKEAQRQFRFAPLALAARKGLTAAARWLLENGADPDVPSRDLCPCDNNPKMSKGMWHVPHQATRPPMEQPHWTALHLAIHYGHDDIVELLLTYGADARQVCRAEDGPCSALHTAFAHRRRSIAESLMHHFGGTDMAEINARGLNGITPLHIAYCVGSRSLFDMALRFGAYVNLEYEIDGNNWTLFAMACANEDWAFALRLLRLGANEDFDLERMFGGRWTTDGVYRSISESYNPDAAALREEMDHVLRDHEIAYY